MARPRQFTDGEILDAARRCFLEHGAQVSTSHIAKEIGLSQAALFKRFQTKENLLLCALAPPETPEWIRELEDGPREGPIDEQLMAIGIHALRFLRKLMPRVMVLKSAGLEPSSVMSRYEVPPPLRAMRMMKAFAESAHAQGRMGPVDARAFAMQFMGAVQARAYFGHMFNLPSTPAEDEAYVRGFVGNLWRGLAPVETP